MSKKANAINVKKFLSTQEIESELSGVEYIILVSPSVRENPLHPVHFTLFLNTQENLPQHIADAIVEKFAREHSITNIVDLINLLDLVALAKTDEHRPMPMHIYKKDEADDIPHRVMYIIDFEADSANFSEVKKNSLTGWTYIDSGE